MSLRTTVISHIFMLLLFQNMANTLYAKRYKRQTAANVNNNNNNSNNNNSYHEPHFVRNRSVIVQLFEWKFVDIATECRTFLGPQGYAGVQISPVLEHTVVKTEQLKHPWWERYELVSYRLASRSGDESEFWSMSRICNEHGVRVYVDVVLNHMAAPLHLIVPDSDTNQDFLVDTLLETNISITDMRYPNATYSRLDFHQPECQITANTQDAHEIRNCQLNNHPDLDHSRGSVQKHMVKMMNKFIDMGVAGFRIDAAKYMWPIDLRNIYQQLKSLNTEFGFEALSRPFIYQDILDLGLDTVSKTEYTTYGVVSEYLYAAELATIFNGKAPLSSLINWGPALGFLPSTDALVFIDSHDTQRGLPVALGHNHLLTHRQRIKYIMANVFMLAHPYGGIKRIMSSYYFTEEDINQGPPTEGEEGEDISAPQFDKQGQCTKASGWVCEHRWPPMVAMVQMANYFSASGQQEESIIYFQTNGPNQVAFCRGSQAFVAINNDKEMDFNMEVYACLEPGVYCDVVTGGRKEQNKAECHGKQLVINEQSYAQLQLHVADGNRVGTEDEIENEIEENEENEEEEQEEETGLIESYGILVIYKDSKLQATADANLEGEDKNLGEPTDDKNKENADDQAGERENHDTAQDANNEGEVNDEEPIEEQPNDEEANEGDPTNDSNEIDEGEEKQEDEEQGKADEKEENEEESHNDSKEEENAEVEEPGENKEDEGETPQTNSNQMETEDEGEDVSVNDVPDVEESKQKGGEEEVEEPGENKEDEGEDKKKEEAPETNSNETEGEVEGKEVTVNEVPDAKEGGREEEEEIPQVEIEAEVEDESKTDDIPDNIEGSEQVDLVKENSEENKENLEDNTEAIAEGTEVNLSRNLEDPNAEEQVERPSADIVETSAEEKTKNVVAAGFLSNSKQNGNNG